MEVLKVLRTSQPISRRYIKQLLQHLNLVPTTLNSSSIEENHMMLQNQNLKQVVLQIRSPLQVIQMTHMIHLCRQRDCLEKESMSISKELQDEDTRTK